jgi:hypothetical protein
MDEVTEPRRGIAGSRCAYYWRRHVPEAFDVAATGIAVINGTRHLTTSSSHSKLVPFDSNLSTQFLPAILFV